MNQWMVSAIVIAAVIGAVVLLAMLLPCEGCRLRRQRALRHFVEQVVNKKADAADAVE